jgi:uncharacterized protein (TIGR03083 family)
MIFERQVDCGAIYRRLRRRLIARARGWSGAQLATPVPATPLWSVHDVLAHLVGITADLNALEFDAADPEEWTQKQVLRRRGRSVEELGAEWDREGPRFEEGLGLLGYELGSHYVGDLLLHTTDVDQALGAGQPDDEEALAVALDFYLDAFHQALCTAGAGSVVLAAGPEEWTLGPGPIVASVRTGTFEAFRSLGGRRSARQLEALEWSGDPAGIIGLMSPYPLPRHDLIDF